MVPLEKVNIFKADIGRLFSTYLSIGEQRVKNKSVVSEDALLITPPSALIMILLLVARLIQCSFISRCNQWIHLRNRKRPVNCCIHSG